MILHSFFTSSITTFLLHIVPFFVVVDVEGYLFVIFLIDILNATKEVGVNKKACCLFFFYGRDMQLVTWIMI